MPSMGDTLLDASGVKRTLSRLAHEILDACGGGQDVVAVGVLRRGYPVAKRLAFLMTQIEGTTIPCGKLDARSHRDDAQGAVENHSEIPFQITGKIVILVDEVVFTGRTARAALDAIMKFGRPKAVRFAVLVDRGHRELPIQPDFVGRRIETNFDDHVLVKLNEYEGEDGVELLSAQEARS